MSSEPVNNFVMDYCFAKDKKDKINDENFITFDVTKKTIKNLLDENSDERVLECNCNATIKFPESCRFKIFSF